MLTPTLEAFALVAEMRVHLEKLVEAHRDSHDGLGVSGEDLLCAARSLASLEWRVIREERLHVTLLGLW